MKAALTAGGTFAVTVLLGFFAGLAIGKSMEQGLWAVAGLFAGVLLGGFFAIRALLQAGK